MARGDDRAASVVMLRMGSTSAVSIFEKGSTCM